MELGRSALDRELTEIREDVLALSHLVDGAIDDAMTALYVRDPILAQTVIDGDEQINILRYQIEESCLRTIATQQPAARDLRAVMAATHIAVELERIGDHAVGTARLVTRLEAEDEITSLHKLPKMAKRARKMTEQGVQAYINEDVESARQLLDRDAKIDKMYKQLFRETLAEMHDDDYIRRATFLLWVGHNLERIGDRSINIAERVIFMVTNEFVETLNYMDDDE
jgi:phosphate transport system protein